MTNRINSKIQVDLFRTGNLLTEVQLNALETEGLKYSHRIGEHGNTMVFHQDNQIIHMTQTPTKKYRICYTGTNGNGQTRS